MSFAVDVNTLLYASDEASPFHDRASRFLTERAAGAEIFCLAWPTVMSYLRMATHSGIFARPLTAEEAIKNVDALVRLPHVRVLAEEEGFWEAYQAVVRDTPARGNQVPDAHLATLLRQHGVSTLYTRDRDFRRFDFLRVIDPFAGGEDAE